MTTRSVQVITAKAAGEAIGRAATHAGQLGVTVVIVVVDPSGETVAMRRMDAAPLLAVGVAADKAWTVSAFSQPTHWWADLLADNPQLAPLGANNRLMPVPGGVPIVVGEAMVGAVGVSGATGEQDRAIAEAGATTTGQGLTAEAMEQTIRDYFAACNSGHADAVATFFTEDGVHYFPPGMYEGPFRVKDFGTQRN